MATNRRLYELNEDVLRRILEQVAAIKDTTYAFSITLKRLSTTCKRIRSSCMPILFRNCRVIVNQGIPPVAIRPYVRYITYIWAFYTIDQLYDCDYFKAKPVATFAFQDTSVPRPTFGIELDYLPSVRSVTFSYSSVASPGPLSMKCMAHPTITSISINEDAMWLCAPPPVPSDLASHSRPITKFRYTTSHWREIEALARGTSLRATYDQELSYLRALVLPMSDSAESLTLPVETAPLLEMAAMDWPRLHTLSLIGRYTHSDQCLAISPLLMRSPNLRSLSVQVVQRQGMPRPLLLRAPPDAKYHLRSLILSYPNPDDPIFSWIGDGLTSLSLRDSPKHYHESRYKTPSLTAVFPIPHRV
ncbi:hypothetical protein BV20DRAFT_1066809 [Pilatotrama ljubarskyi]|nr:hypothetical protein BV20DRAFT_1066809 [Pilatotrama ljubarskyi]